MQEMVSFYSRAKTRAKTESAYLDEFELKAGIYPRATQSVLLFVLAVDVITENVRGGVITEVLYADNLVLTSAMA